MGKKKDSRRQDGYIKLTVWIPKNTRQGALLKGFKQFAEYINTKATKLLPQVLAFWLSNHPQTSQLLKVDKKAFAVFQPYWNKIAEERAEKYGTEKPSAVIEENQEEPLKQEEETENVGSDDESIPSGEAEDNRGQ